jgi:hypothetical protein
LFNFLSAHGASAASGGGLGCDCVEARSGDLDCDSHHLVRVATQRDFHLYRHRLDCCVALATASGLENGGRGDSLVSESKIHDLGIVTFVSSRAAIGCGPMFPFLMMRTDSACDGRLDRVFDRCLVISMGSLAAGSVHDHEGVNVHDGLPSARSDVFSHAPFHRHALMTALALFCCRHGDRWIDDGAWTLSLRPHPH